MVVAPFDFIILFFAFIYTLGLTHLYFAMTRMIRHRRELVFSWPHFLWMVVALFNLFANWLSLYDFHHHERFSTGALAVGLLVSMLIYFQCSLVSPDFERGESYDMRAFHREESSTYIGVTLMLVIVSLVVNYAVSVLYSMPQVSAQNGLVASMAPPCVMALVWRNRWVQILCPLVLVLQVIAFIALFYPALTR